jgi:hypothetical protein
MENGSFERVEAVRSGMEQHAPWLQDERPRRALQSGFAVIAGKETAQRALTEPSQPSTSPALTPRGLRVRHAACQVLT